MSSSEPHERTDEPRISLAGPDPLDVLRALLKVDPDASPADQGDEADELPQSDRG